MKKLIFLLFSIILLSSACRKDRPIPEYFLDQSTKDYMCFKTGTWWIYTDTVTGETEYQRVLSDTIFMLESIDHHRDPNVIIDKREYYKWNTSTEVFSAYPYAQDTTNNRIKDAITRSKHPGSNATHVFFYPFIDKILKPNGLTVVSLYNTYDLLIILNKTYINVVAFHETSNSMENGYETITYIGKHYGIIRKDILIEGINGLPDKWKYLLLTDSEIIQ